MRSSSSAGLVKPALSRSNHAGADTAAKISRMIENAAATGSSPRFQRAMNAAKTTKRTM